MQNRSTLSLFLAAVALQAAIVAYIPIRASQIRNTGKEVFLPLRPVDPYGIFTGYSMRLGYEAGDMEKIPGAREDTFRRDQSCYVRVRKAEDGMFEPVSITKDLPSVAPDEAVLRGYYRGWSNVKFGIESFYFPETVQDEINEEASTALRQEEGKGRDRRDAYAEVRVDDNGQASLIALHLNGKRYQY